MCAWHVPAHANVQCCLKSFALRLCHCGQKTRYGLEFWSLDLPSARVRFFGRVPALLRASKKDSNWSYRARKHLGTFSLKKFPSRMSSNVFEVNEDKAKKKMFGSYYVLKNIGRVGRDFFIILFFLFFNLHDSLELDGFDKGLPCCNCLYMH